MKKITVFLVLFGLAICLLKCTNQYANKEDARGAQYAGAASCVKCHKDITDAYIHSNHFHTSSEVDFEKFKQLITSSNDTVHFPNDQLVKLEALHNKLYQSYVLNGQEMNSASMDIAFGSGEKAWTFGYWKDGGLYQLPLTYLAELKRWTNSPGFTPRQPNYTRPIISRCMECHSSYAYAEKSLEQGMHYTEKINAATIIYGIDCERCHGPAAHHVAFHTDSPLVKTAKYILSIKSLSRQQQIDLCGTCHSGDPAKLQSIFAFKPGDTLSNYYMYYPGAVNPDAHGMQVQSLEQSKCFLQSTLTCTTCHDVHTSERNKEAVFIQRCMNCHQQSSHAVTMQQANNYCANCHMPQQASKSLDFANSTELKDIKYRLRTHRIAIYSGTGTF